MASTAGLPLYIHQEEQSVLALSDSEDEDMPLTPRDTLHSRNPSQAESASSAGEESVLRRDGTSNVPLHPIPVMQPAFAESLIEATAETPVQKPKLRFGDAKERRARLIDAEKGAPLAYELWRHRPGQSHHELWKLMAQISFGVYLLLNGIANSNVQVVNILQGHIDEIDEYLEVTLEDVQVATEDIRERIDFLKLPMQNLPTFEKMLEDRAFRLQIVTGNEKIEHIVNRTATALQATMQDAEEGLRSTKEFAAYLEDQQNQSWRDSRPDVIDIFDAMKGNAEGWYKAFVDLQESATALDNILVRLGQMVADMDRRAGEVSRRTIVSHKSSAYSLSIRASALMPLQFSIAPFTDPTLDNSRNSVLSPPASRKSSQVSTPNRDRSASSSSHADSGPMVAGNSPQNSPPTSPSARDTLQEIQFKSAAPQRRSSALKRGIILEIDPADLIDSPVTATKPSPIQEEGLYILQPRTYTPQPPEPAASPLAQNPPSPVRRMPSSPGPDRGQPDSAPHRNDSSRLDGVPRKPSLRDRLSLKGSRPPEAIHVPPRNVNRPQLQIPQVEQPQVLEPQHSQLHPPPEESPRARPSSPRIQYVQQIHIPDSAYASDFESRPPFQSVDDHLGDLSPPVFPNTIPSPRSDQQHYRPVQASPHSPLQRPWTAGPVAVPRPHTSATNYAPQRNAPSAMGMSMLSNVTTMNPDGKTLKKKRSAFGWLKKAFSLDEEERAAFEARKHLQAENLYNEGRSPKYLDGRRRDDYRRY